MLDNFKVNFLQKGSVKTFNSSDKFSRINSSNMDIWWFLGRIFFLMSYFVGDCAISRGHMEHFYIHKTSSNNYAQVSGPLTSSLGPNLFMTTAHIFKCQWKMINQFLFLTCATK